MAPVGQFDNFILNVWGVLWGKELISNVSFVFSHTAYLEYK